jgi:hypothetical protein
MARALQMRAVHRPCGWGARPLMLLSVSGIERFEWMVACWAGAEWNWSVAGLMHWWKVGQWRHAARQFSCSCSHGYGVGHASSATCLWGSVGCDSRSSGPATAPRSLLHCADQTRTQV